MLRLLSGIAIGVTAVSAYQVKCWRDDRISQQREVLGAEAVNDNGDFERSYEEALGMAIHQLNWNCDQDAFQEMRVRLPNDRVVYIVGTKEADGSRSYTAEKLDGQRTYLARRSMVLSAKTCSPVPGLSPR